MLFGVYAAAAEVGHGVVVAGVENFLQSLQVKNLVVRYLVGGYQHVAERLIGRRIVFHHQLVGV